jgi:hypothetical protein
MYKLYETAQTLDEWPGEAYDGSSVRGGMKALQKAGYITNYLWLPTARIAIEQSIQDMTDFMLQGYGTVVLGTDWFLSMDDVDSDGYIVEPGTTDTPIGGHAYRINWYSKKKDAFLVVNSWGHSWGEESEDGEMKGTAWMRPTLLRRLLLAYGEVACPTEVKVK